MAPVGHLARALKLEFQDQQLFELALTHKSYTSQSYGQSYERLEFLGDAVLDLVVSEKLYSMFPQVDEGQLSRMRSELVKKPSLANIARELELSDCIRLGEGELKSGGFNRDSILADIVESIIGALYLDQGLAVTSEFIQRIFKQKLSALSGDQGYKDPKSLLQEHFQEINGSLPEYSIEAVAGAQHEQQFTVVCRLPDSDTEFVESGSSRRKAEQAAATMALNSLKNSKTV
jgi:ribonuclease III